MIRTRNLMHLALLLASSAVAAPRAVQDRNEEPSVGRAHAPVDLARDKAFLDELVALDLPEVLGQWLAEVPEIEPSIDSARDRALLELRRNRPLERSAQENLVDSIMARNAARIAMHENHPDLGSWLLDHASDLILEIAPRQGADLQVAFGLASPEETARIRGLYDSALAALHRAGRALEAAVAAEGSAGGTDHRRRRLERDELGQRHPLLRGLAMSWKAYLSPEGGVENDRVAKAALLHLESVQISLGGALLDRARLAMALARYRTDDLAGAQRDAELVEAAAPLSSPDGLGARLLLTLIAARKSTPREALEQRWGAIPASLRDTDILPQLLIADQSFRLLTPAETSRRSGVAWRGACERLTALPLLVSEPLRAAMRDLVLERLSRELPPSLAPGELTPIAALGVLVRDLSAVGTALSGDRASEVLGEGRALASRDGLDGGVRLSIALHLAPALERAGGATEGADVLARAVELGGADPAAEPALDLALALALGSRARSEETFADTARRVLTLALERRDQDSLRVALAQIEIDAGDPGRAEAILSAITGRSASSASARFLEILIAQQGVRVAGDPAAILAAHRTVRAAIEAKRPEIIRSADPLRDGLLAKVDLIEIEAIAALEGAASALARLNEMDESRLALLAQEATNTRINLLRDLGRLQEAAELLARLGERDPVQARVVLASLVTSFAQRIRLLRDEADEEGAQRVAVDEAAPLVRSLLAAPQGDAPSAAVRRAAAEILLVAGSPDEALPMYESLLREAPDTADDLLGRAECLVALVPPRDEEAMLVYRRLAQGGDAVPQAMWWLAQARMIEISARQGGDPEKAAARIRRLRAQDPHLGGARSRAIIERVERRLAD